MTTMTLAHALHSQVSQAAEKDITEVRTCYASQLTGGVLCRAGMPVVGPYNDGWLIPKDSTGCLAFGLKAGIDVP